jgi:hypothetical protein
MTTTARPRKATTPRKAARPKAPSTNGSPNGHAPVEETPVEETTVVAGGPDVTEDVRPPEEVKIDLPPGPKHPYKHEDGTPYTATEVFAFQPSGDYPPIVFPAVTTLAPTPKFFWKIYPLNEMYQAFEWMILANVPRHIQEQVMDMGERNPREQADFFRRWFAPISRPQGGPTPPGES